MRLRAGWAREELDRRLAEGADPGADRCCGCAERLVTQARAKACRSSSSNSLWASLVRSGSAADAGHGAVLA
jgi:hypothetical protein